jgi:hypothetical protein
MSLEGHPAVDAIDTGDDSERSPSSSFPTSAAWEHHPFS